MSLIFFQFSCKHISKHCGGQSRGIGIDQEKQRFIAEKLRTKLNQPVNGIFDFPDFSFGPPAIGRGIHDDCVIVISTADFPFHKFYAVVHKPADGCIAKPGGV